MRQVLRRDSNCIDVGANKGGMFAEMVRLAPDGRHFALEPIPHLAEELRQRFPKAVIFNLAASDNAGEVEFHHFVQLNGFSGFKRRDLGVANPEVEVLRVPTDTLNRLIPADLRIHLIKIDVEGAELLVLRGARELLRRCRPVVIFEHGLGGSDLYGAGPEAVHDLLVGDCGLEIAPLEGWTPRAAPLSRAGFVRHFYERLGFMFVTWNVTGGGP